MSHAQSTKSDPVVQWSNARRGDDIMWDLRWQQKSREAAVTVLVFRVGYALGLRFWALFARVGLG